jgi:hypothetical protein
LAGSLAGSVAGVAGAAGAFGFSPQPTIETLIATKTIKLKNFFMGDPLKKELQNQKTT